MREHNRNEAYNGAFGPMYEVRLGDLRAWHEVRAQCLRCTHAGPVQLDALHCQGDAGTRLVDLTRRLRCSRCGNRGDNWFELLRIKRD